MVVLGVAETLFGRHQADRKLNPRTQRKSVKIGKRRQKRRSKGRMEILQDNPKKGESGEDMYMARYGSSVARIGKVFSYTFWRMQMNNDIFWSVQGNDLDGSGGAWIATQYFGPPERACQFIQEVTLTHPIETKIQMRYSSTLVEGRNCVFISKNLVHHFKNEDNSFNFDFRITRRTRKKSRRRC